MRGLSQITIYRKKKDKHLYDQEYIFVDTSFEVVGKIAGEYAERYHYYDGGTTVKTIKKGELERDYEEVEIDGTSAYSNHEKYGHSDYGYSKQTLKNGDVVAYAKCGEENRDCDGKVKSVTKKQVEGENNGK